MNFRPSTGRACDGRPDMLGCGYMAMRDATAAHSAAADPEERHRLTALEGLAALSLDALSSVAYGPEAILIALVAAGGAGLRDPPAAPCAEGVLPAAVGVCPPH